MINVFELQISTLDDFDYTDHSYGRSVIILRFLGLTQNGAGGGGQICVCREVPHYSFNSKL